MEVSARTAAFVLPCTKGNECPATKGIDREGGLIDAVAAAADGGACCNG